MRKKRNGGSFPWSCRGPHRLWILLSLAIVGTACSPLRPAATNSVVLEIPGTNQSQSKTRPAQLSQKPLSKLSRVKLQSPLHKSRSVQSLMDEAFTPEETEAFIRLDSLPDDWTGFDCLGVQVSGSGIDSDLSAFEPVSSCSGGDFELQDYGRIAGIVSVATGGTVQVDLPAGSSRSVQLVGFRTFDGSCPEVESLRSFVNSVDMDSTELTDASLLIGNFYELDRTVVDLFSDTTVRMQPVFDPDSPHAVICDDTSFSGSTSVFVEELLVDAVSYYSLWANLTSGELAADPTGVSYILGPQVGMSGTRPYQVSGLLNFPRVVLGLDDPSTQVSVGFARSGAFGAGGSVYSITSTVSGFTVGFDAPSDVSFFDFAPSLEISGPALKDSYGRSLGTVSIPLSTSVSEMAASLSSVMSVSRDSIPSLGGYDSSTLPGNDLLTNSMYLYGACGSEVDHLGVEISDITGALLVADVQCSQVARDGSMASYLYFFDLTALGAPSVDRELYFYISAYDSAGVWVNGDWMTLTQLAGTAGGAGSISFSAPGP